VSQEGLDPPPVSSALFGGLSVSRGGGRQMLRRDLGLVLNLLALSAVFDLCRRGNGFTTYSNRVPT
jgi:hypothetical protein